MSPVSHPRVLFLIDVLYSAAAGAEGVLRRLVRALPKEGYRCSIATLASAPARVARDRFACPVHCLPVHHLWGISAWRAAWLLSRLLRAERVAILHTFFPASDLLGAVVARLSRTPVMISSRRDMGFQRTLPQRLAYRAAAPLFDQVQAVSEEVRVWHIAQDRLDPSRVVTVRNGVDLDEIDAMPPHRPAGIGLPDAAPVVVTVGNLRPVKGTDQLVRVAARVGRQAPDAHFLVVGAPLDPAYFQRVRALAEQLGVAGRVHFAGGRDNVAAVLKACTVFYLPSLSEGLSNALLEAMACGLPCVAHHVGGNAEVVASGRSGYLTPLGAEQETADAIVELLRSPARAAAMGRAGRQIVESRFSLNAMVSQLAALYDGLLARVPGFARQPARRMRSWPAPGGAENQADGRALL